MPFSSLQPQLGEWMAASAAALIAAYVKAKGDPRAWSLRGFVARAAEAVVCGFIAIGVAGWMEWSDPRTTVGLAASAGLIGTQALTDLLMRVAAKQTGPAAK